MALNVVTFRTRALTALVFAAIMLAGLLWNQWSFLILFSVIHFGCWLEYQRLVGLIDPEYAKITRFHKYGVMLAGWCIMLYFTNDLYRIGNISLRNVGYWGGLILLFVLPALEVLFTRQIKPKLLAHSIFGLIYISLSLGLLTDLGSIKGPFYGGSLNFFDRLPVLIIIGGIWINDTMAYIVGSLIGKTQLTSISPKKTWEGTIGGILLSIIVMGVISYFVSSELDWETIIQWMIIAAIVSIAGTFGDLLESKLKRLANVKDSGRIMPGHGGFLDRFDSLLLATPFVWLYIEKFLR
ncbi:MAG: CDP-archaeol synthase [Bacteroidetes bacterium]|nr:CDP-archaeol synthase [Bacteroidota bacterium]